MSAIKNILKGRAWIVLTATREKIDGVDVPWDHAENVRANVELEATLKHNGLDYHVGEGMYKSNEQGPSFLVRCRNFAESEQMLYLSRYYQQESTLVPEGLCYDEGTTHWTVKERTDRILFGAAALAEDFYTKIGDEAFSCLMHDPTESDDYLYYQTD